MTNPALSVSRLVMRGNPEEIVVFAQRLRSRIAAPLAIQCGVKPNSVTAPVSFETVYVDGQPVSDDGECVMALGFTVRSRLIDFGRVSFGIETPTDEESPTEEQLEVVADYVSATVDRMVQFCRQNPEGEDSLRVTSVVLCSEESAEAVEVNGGEQ